MFLKTYFTLLTLLLLVTEILGSADFENCINPKFSISQSVENEGFHRDINWLVESLDVSNNSNCKVSLQLNVPAGIFVNPHEISELVRVGQISAYIKGDVNIELPAHEAVGHTVYVFLPKDDLIKVAVQLPVHLRYQRAMISGGFGKVNLGKPSLLIHCPRNVQQVCNKFPEVQAPCDVTGSALCVWRNVSYQALFDEVQLFVPIGDLDDYPLVSIVTLLLGCAGSIYILSLLSAAPL